MVKKAFTLIELLIVVVIIGVVYGLVISSMKKINDKEAHLGFESLPAYLESMHQENHVAFTCIDNCRSCAIYVDREKVKDVDPFMKDEHELRFWRFDVNFGMQELLLTPIFNEDEREFDVCFNYEIFADGSSTEMTVETKDATYVYHGLLHKVDRYISLQAAQEAQQEVLEKVLQ